MTANANGNGNNSHPHPEDGDDERVGDLESQGEFGRRYSSASQTEPLLEKRTNTSSQIAILGSNVYNIESLDYDILENELLKQDWRSRTRTQIFQYVVLKWGFAMLIGLGTGLVGIFNNIAIENISGFKLLLFNNFMYHHKYFQAFGALLSCNVSLGVAAAVLCAFIAPAAAGSGIPEVKAYLNGIDAPEILAPSTLLIKIFGSVLAVSAGFVVGKEGPMVHTGACIAALLGQGGSRKYHLTCSWLRFFKNDRDRRDLVTCGAAAGVAAAFRAPVGGVLFALEEAASWWRSALLWRTFFTTAVVAIVLRGFIQFCSDGRCGLFGKGGLIMFDVSAASVMFGSVDILAVLLLGVVGGLLGSLYNYLVDKVVRTYSIVNEHGRGARVLLAMTISILTTCCAYGFPWLAGCTPCPNNSAVKCPTRGESGNFKSFQCPPGHYNDLASLFLTTNDDAIRHLFISRTTKEFQILSLVIFFPVVFFLGIVTYGIAVPSGLFIPVILAGASYGRLAGRLLQSISQLDTGLFALLGAASLLGGTMRMTVSLCVILLELTNDLILLPLVMLVLLISKTVADSFNKGVYDQILRIKGLPYLEAHAEPFMRSLTTRDAVYGNPIGFSGVERVRDVLEVLRNTGHNGFPVVDGDELVGIVLRSHLLVLLKGKHFASERAGAAGGEWWRRENLGVEVFGKAGSGKGLKVEDLVVDEEEMDMYVDLHPITNTSPYTVVETMSLAKAAILFRQLGLRHLCVVPRKTDGGRGPIVGILTRHDLIPDHVLDLHPHLDPRKTR